MKILEDIISKIFLQESVSATDVENAIDNHNRVVINYHSKGENKANGARVVEVYAYGLTKAGNPCIRCFQPYGSTTTRVPSWKLFRLDRITDWKPTKQTFNHSADFYYKNLGEFNEKGDETMSVVYKIADFSNINDKDKTVANTSQQTDKPKTQDDIFKTDTEKQMERLKQQTENPITLKDLNSEQEEQSSSPKTNQDIYKTDTERGMENLKKQLENPQMIDLSKIPQK